MYIVIYKWRAHLFQIFFDSWFGAYNLVDIIAHNVSWKCLKRVVKLNRNPSVWATCVSTQCQIPIRVFVANANTRLYWKKLMHLWTGLIVWQLPGAWSTCFRKQPTTYAETWMIKVNRSPDWATGVFTVKVKYQYGCWQVQTSGYTQRS